MNSVFGYGYAIWELFAASDASECERRVECISMHIKCVRIRLFIFWKKEFHVENGFIAFFVDFMNPYSIIHKIRQNTNPQTNRQFRELGARSVLTVFAHRSKQKFNYFYFSVSVRFGVRNKKWVHVKSWIGLFLAWVAGWGAYFWNGAIHTHTHSISSASVHRIRNSNYGTLAAIVWWWLLWFKLIWWEFNYRSACVCNSPISTYPLHGG